MRLPEKDTIKEFVGIRDEPWPQRLSWVFKFLMSGGVSGIFFGFSRLLPISLETNAIISLSLALVIFIISTAFYETTPEEIREEEKDKWEKQKEEMKKQWEEHKEEMKEQWEEQERLYKGQLISITKSVEAISSNYSRSFQYESLEFRYYIGRVPEDDHWTRNYELEPENRIYVKNAVQFGGRGDSIGEIKQWKKINVEITEPEDKRIEIVPRLYAYDSNIWMSELFFLPPIEPGQRTSFTMTGKYPGVWNPLREDGLDNGDLQLRYPAKKLKIVLVFPPEIDDAQFDYCEPANLANPPRGETKSNIDKEGRKQLIWKVTNAQSQKYKYRVRSQDYS